MTERDRILAVLAVHRHEQMVRGEWQCQCGVALPDVLRPEANSTLAESHRAHLADVLAAALAPETGLDAAWAAAEAALPEGWRFAALRRRYVGARGQGKGWSATAVQAGLNTEDRRHGTVPSKAGYGPTPTAALVALTAALTARTEEPL